MGDYSHIKVNEYITDVMLFHPLDRVQLWQALQGHAMHGADERMTQYVLRFERLNLAEQANVLYRFGPILEKVARDVAKAKSKKAREAGEM